jgi:sulfate adenylyltransferase subunit 1 (EFTu-like GTPase family)
MGAPIRLVIAGHVDDGKSTLIGRLLADAGQVPDDQLARLAHDSRRFGTCGTDPDYALLLDGLQQEREQGITVDVAWRYFALQGQRFIVGDAPGHQQYTRNFATAASVADAAILLADARAGLTTQTRRHAASSPPSASAPSRWRSTSWTSPRTRQPPSLASTPTGPRSPPN